MSDISVNPWTSAFRSFISRSNEPRLKSTWQYYHTKHGHLVTEEYERRGASSNTDRLKLRNEIAREQFFSLPAEDQLALERECMTKYEEELDLWEKGQVEEPVLTEEMQAE